MNSETIQLRVLSVVVILGAQLASGEVSFGYFTGNGANTFNFKANLHSHDSNGNNTIFDATTSDNAGLAFAGSFNMNSGPLVNYNFQAGPGGFSPFDIGYGTPGLYLSMSGFSSGGGYNVNGQVRAEYSSPIAATPNVTNEKILQNVNLKLTGHVTGGDKVTIQFQGYGDRLTDTALRNLVFNAGDFESDFNETTLTEAFNGNNPSVNGRAFLTVTIDRDPTNSETTWVNLDPPSNGSIDVVPEPCSIFLAMIGIVGFLFHRKNRTL